MKPTDVDELFDKKVIIDELKSNLNDNGGKEASVVTQVIQEDAYLNTEIKKRVKIASENQDEENPEELDTNET